MCPSQGRPMLWVKFSRRRRGRQLPSAHLALLGIIPRCALAPRFAFLSDTHCPPTVSSHAPSPCTAMLLFKQMRFSFTFIFRTPLVAPCTVHIGAAESQRHRNREVLLEEDMGGESSHPGCPLIPYRKHRSSTDKERILTSYNL